MPAVKKSCPACAKEVYEVQKNIGGLILLDPGKIEIAFRIVSYDAYTTQEGFRIHKCLPKP